MSSCPIDKAPYYHNHLDNGYDEIVKYWLRYCCECKNKAQGNEAEMVNIALMLNKNTLGVKKVRGQSEATLQIGMCDQKL